MKVEVNQTQRVHAESWEKNGKQSQTAIIPALDSWYARLRTPPLILLFETMPESRDALRINLVRSLSRTLDQFPQFAGDMDMCTVDEKRRHGVTWGAEDEPGALFIEAEARSSIQSLLPPAESKSSDGIGFIWDLSAASCRPLFVDEHPLVWSQERASAARAQMTVFECGGFSLAMDLDHGLADGTCVGTFARHWAATYNAMAHDMTPSPSLPLPHFQPELLGQLASDASTKPEERENALALPTSVPYLNAPASNGTSALSNISSPASIPPMPTGDGVFCLLRVSAAEYERIATRIQSNASGPVTDQIALVAHVAAAVNRARVATGLLPMEINLPLDLRSRLDLPGGLTGCPIILSAVELPGNNDAILSSVDSVEIATAASATFARYKEDAVYAIIQEAETRDSPGGPASGRPSSQGRLCFSVVGGSGFHTISLGTKRPAFVCINLPVSAMAFVKEASTSEEAGTTAQKHRYGSGMDVFLTLPQDVFEAFVSDPEFAKLTKLLES